MISFDKHFVLFFLNIQDEPMQQSTPMPINCLSPSSLLASQFSQSIVFSPPSSDDRLSSHRHHVFLPNQATNSATNLLLSLTASQNRFDYYHPQQRRDSPALVTTPTTPSPSSTSSNSHVLCR